VAYGWQARFVCASMSYLEVAYPAKDRLKLMAEIVDQGVAELIPLDSSAWVPHVGPETNQVLGALGIEDADDRRQILADALQIMSRSVSPRAAAEAVTGLAVGHIQSGKTSSFTVVAALARDNGYAMVIVIAGTSLPLFRQSDARLRHDLAVDRHLAGENQRARAFARRREAAIDERRVQPRALRQFGKQDFTSEVTLATSCTGVASGARSRTRAIRRPARAGAIVARPASSET